MRMSVSMTRCAPWSQYLSVKVMKGLKWCNSQILVPVVAVFILVKHPANKLFLRFLLLFWILWTQIIQVMCASLQLAQSISAPTAKGCFPKVCLDDAMPYFSCIKKCKCLKKKKRKQKVVEEDSSSQSWLCWAMLHCFCYITIKSGRYSHAQKMRDGYLSCDSSCHFTLVSSDPFPSGTTSGLKFSPHRFLRGQKEHALLISSVHFAKQRILRQLLAILPNQVKRNELWSIIYCRRHAEPPSEFPHIAFSAYMQHIMGIVW